jgi:hypothetical protein
VRRLSHAIGHADCAEKKLTPSAGSGSICAGINWARSFDASIRSVLTSSTSAAIERMLIVELDGGQHEDQRAQDEARTQWLSEQGFRVLRFSDREALMETEAVLTEIQNHL